MRGNAARGLPPGLAALSLVGVVAVAATGSTQGGSDETRRPSDLVFDTFFSLSLLVLIPAAALLVYGLMQRRAIAQEVASVRRGRSPGRPVFRLTMSRHGNRHELATRPLGSNGHAQGLTLVRSATSAAGRSWRVRSSRNRPSGPMPPNG